MVVVPEIRLIDLAVGRLPEKKQLIIRVKYLEENKDKYVQWVLRKKHKKSNRDTYYRWKAEAVEELVKMFGELGVAE